MDGSVTGHFGKSCCPQTMFVLAQQTQQGKGTQTQGCLLRNASVTWQGETFNITFKPSFLPLLLLPCLLPMSLLAQLPYLSLTYVLDSADNSVPPLTLLSLSSSSPTSTNFLSLSFPGFPPFTHKHCCFILSFYSSDPPRAPSYFPRKVLFWPFVLPGTPFRVSPFPMCVWWDPELSSGHRPPLLLLLE